MKTQKKTSASPASPLAAQDHTKTSGTLSTQAPGLPLSTILAKALELTVKALLPRDMVILCITLAWSLMGALTALCNRIFIDAAAQVVGTKDLGLLVPALVWLGLIMLIEAGNLVVHALNDRKTQVIWRTVALWCEETLIIKASTMEYRHFGNQGTINQLTRANNEFASRMQRVLGGMFRVVSGIISVLAVLVVLLAVAWYIPVILLAFSLPAVFLYRLQTAEAYSSAVHSTGSTRRVWYFLTLLTTRSALKEIRFGGIHDYLCQRHDECADEVARIRLTVVRRYALFNILGNLIRYLGFFVVLVLTVNLILQGQATLGTLALVLSAAATLQGSFMAAANALADIRDSGRYFQDYLTIMDASGEGCSDPAELGGLDTAAEEADIVCKDLWFTYPGNSDATLKGLDLTIRQGERIAIVGENGSGKSTFVSLLCGLYSPDSGQLTIAGKDSVQDRDHTRKVVSAALQEFQRYEMDAASNIRVGNPYRQVSQDEVESAARLMGIHERIISWPQGYATHLGQLKEGGVDMSGGEWQKLILARTLVKSEARIMILDEPTASLDPPSEAALYSAYGEITGDRTSILVSHRLGSCKIADRILVFHQGRIVEQGTHAQLMEKRGHYHTMFSAQSSWYSHVSQA